METTESSIWKAGLRCLRMLGVGLSIGVVVLLGPTASPATNGPSPQAHGNDADYEDEMLKGRDSLRRHKYEDALKSFKRANEMRDNKPPECLLLVAESYQGLEAYRNVIETCDKVIQLEDTDSRLRSHAYNMKGIALQSLAQGKDQRRLQEAEAAFRQGLTLNGYPPILHYNLGFTLMQQGRDPDGVGEVTRYVELQPNGAKAEEARKLIENPKRARETYAPEFSVTTSDGEYIAMDDLRGKVVLLDFWGTWCPPCVASVPSLRSLHKKLEKQPSFVIIGISSDSEAEKWRAFTVENRMVWPQYLDRERKVQRAFEVHGFPTYILLDHEGIIRFRHTGAGSAAEVSMEDAIRKYLKIAAKTAPR